MIAKGGLRCISELFDYYRVSWTVSSIPASSALIAYKQHPKTMYERSESIEQHIAG